MNLKDEILKLIELQEIDSKIYKSTEEKDEILPARLKKLKSEFEEKSTDLAASVEKLKNLQLKRKDKEIELETTETGLTKLQTQLYQLKSNKEYQAMLKEIASHKADISVVEENLLSIMEEIETVKKESEIQKEALKREEKTFGEKETGLNEATKDAEAKIKTFRIKRDSLVAGIDKQIILKYEHLLKTRHGSALIPVEGGHCSACQMQLNHQKINEIKMLEHLVSCDNCVRILYILEDIKK